jgi:hypothetical protein
MSDEPTLDDIATALDITLERIATLQEVADGFKNELVRRLTEQGVSSTTTTSGRKITVVRGQTTAWDTEVLKDILTPLGLWEQARIVTEVVDERALERLLDQGQLQQEALQPAMTVKERRPYPKITNNHPGGTRHD